jgi:hypothetical protein
MEHVNTAGGLLTSHGTRQYSRWPINITWNTSIQQVAYYHHMEHVNTAGGPLAYCLITAADDTSGCLGLIDESWWL